MSTTTPAGSDWAARVGERARTVATLARDASRSDDPDVLERLEIQLGELSQMARELMQERYHATFMALADKLESGDRLDDHDHRFLALLITGPATAYRRGEDDVDSWREDIRRVADLLDAAPAEEGAEDAEIVHYLRIQAAVEEGKRVVPDLRFFLSEGERVKRFVSATESIAPEERRFLARVIRDRLSSPRY